ncbi:MAG: peptidyl-prolyl cis-trans isomerase A (cyclophilin A) [Alteromonadaceae bacterium]|jgi:peptidyl-prolyl cis-trans isomerase A (cyclophilin A)
MNGCGEKTQDNSTDSELFNMTFNNTMSKPVRKPLNAIVLAGALCTSLFTWSNIASATIVEFDTSLGPIQINLYDDTTPQTVANFLSYVNSGAYTNSIFHRMLPGFIAQGGGLVYDFTTTLASVPAETAVPNEPVYSNVRGTIAMAKLLNNPNSATSEFFFNLANNSVNLDNQNSGFTVFGQVTADSLVILDALQELSRLGETPLRNFPPADTTDFTATEEHYVLVNNAQITDVATDTAAGLTRPLTTKTTTPPPSTSGGGGGNFGLFGLLLLGAGSLVRRLMKR